MVRRRGWAALLPAVLLAAGCTGPDADPPVSTSSTTEVSSSSSVPTSTSSTSTTSTPVTQLGLLAGPGVDDTQITLGTLVDTTSDRGFLDGLRLWRTSANDAGGICGRSVTLIVNGTDGVPLDHREAYRELGTRVLGFVVQGAGGQIDVQLATSLSTDEIPAIATDGSDDDLLADSPTVVGATTDILAINALDTAISSGLVAAGDSVGIVADGSSAAASALAGIRWFAERTELSLVVQTATGRDIPALDGLPIVFALGDSALTTDVVAGVPDATVITTLAGYDPTALDAQQAQRVQVAMSTPAPGSTQPGAATVETALAAEGRTAGPATFAGYAAGASWGRLLTAACESQQLTRAGVLGARLTVGPASVESVIGASDPALPAGQQLPASRSSAVATGDLDTPSGLAPLTGLVVAAGVEDYKPSR